MESQTAYKLLFADYPDAKFRLFLTVYHRGIGGLSHTIILAAHNQQRSVGGSPAHKKPPNQNAELEG